MNIKVTPNNLAPQNSKINDKYKNIPKEYLKVAEGMEAQYINYMLNELNKTVIKEKPDTPAEQYYKSLINSERAEIMAKTDNGIGIKDLILDQIYPQNMRQRIPAKSAMNHYRQHVSNKGVEHE